MCIWKGAGISTLRRGLRGEARMKVLKHFELRCKECDGGVINLRATKGMFIFKCDCGNSEVFEGE